MAERWIDALAHTRSHIRQPSTAKSAQNWSNSGQHWPTSGNVGRSIGPSVTEFGPHTWPKVEGRTRPTLHRSRPTWAEIDDFGRNRHEFGRLRAKLGLLRDFVGCGPNLAGIAELGANLAQPVKCREMRPGHTRTSSRPSKSRPKLGVPRATPLSAHARDAGAGVVLDAEVDVLRDAEAEAAVVCEVLLP